MREVQESPNVVCIELTDSEDTSSKSRSQSPEIALADKMHESIIRAIIQEIVDASGGIFPPRETGRVHKKAWDYAFHGILPGLIAEGIVRGMDFRKAKKEVAAKVRRTIAEVLAC